MLIGETGNTICIILLTLLNTICFAIHIDPNIQVLLQTPLIVYIGCVYSIRLYSKSTDTKKEGIETMTKKEAIKFPIIAGTALGSLYLAFKYLDKDIVNFLFQFYFTLAGIAVISQFLYTRLKEKHESLTKKVIFTIPKIRFISDVPIDFDLLYVYTLLVSVPIGLLYLITKHYMLNNILGIFFCIFGIESFLIGSTHVGFILLGALFFYDIYFVFFTPLMVTVAKNLDGPIKLMFPKMLDWQTQKDFNMIGLGDIVIPGVFVALMIRYDYYREYQKIIKDSKTVKDSIGNVNVSFKVLTFTTFLWTFFGYFIGILSTLVVMNVFKHAQPALLYLVPGCLIFSSLSALVCMNFKEFFAFDENVAMKELGVLVDEEEKKEEEKKNE